jgi:hypothetical protein
MGFFPELRKLAQETVIALSGGAKLVKPFFSGSFYPYGGSGS